MVGVDSTVYVWFLGQIYVHNTVVSALAVTGSVFMRRFRLFLGTVCTVYVPSYRTHSLVSC